VFAGWSEIQLLGPGLTTANSLFPNLVTVSRSITIDASPLLTVLLFNACWCQAGCGLTNTDLFPQLTSCTAPVVAMTDYGVAVGASSVFQILVLRAPACIWFRVDSGQATTMQNVTLPKLNSVSGHLNIQGSSVLDTVSLPRLNAVSHLRIQVRDTHLHVVFSNVPLSRLQPCRISRCRC
jgi:hypothetical protein